MWITKETELLQAYKSNRLIGFENCKIIQRDILSASQMKLTILVASKVKKHDDWNVVYEIPYKEYAKFCNFDDNTSGGTNYKEFFNNAKKLSKLGIDLETSTEWIHFNWLDHVIVNRKSGTLTYQLDPILIELYKANSPEFSVIQLQDYGVIKGKYALILFELFAKWQKQGHVVKSIEQLRDLFQVGSKYKQPGDFFTKVGEAIAEINKKTQYTFKIKMDIERGKYNAPKNIKFIINPILQLTTCDEKTFIRQKLEVYGIKQAMINMILSSYDEKYILHNICFVEEHEGEIANAASIFAAINDNYAAYIA